MNVGSQKTLPRMPSSVPVMVLGGAALFPHNCLPLYIFEPRYRAMLERALETDRLLAIATPRNRDGTQVLEVGGIGLVRACVRGADGTSHLILEGLGRVRFVAWPQLEPFRQAVVEPFASSAPESRLELERRLAFLRAALRRFEPELPTELWEKMMQIAEPEILLDLAAGAILRDVHHRQSVLEEADAALRQRLLLRLLEEMSPS
jgi:ATP-dependent Lon protease